jgi:amidase
VWNASVLRSQWYNALLALFEHYDYLVLPSAQIFPFDAREHWPKSIAGKSMDTYHRWMEVVIGASLAGLPVVCVPAGFNAQGLPMGLQVIGKPLADFSVLQLANAYDQATQWVKRRLPPALGA